MKGFLFLKADGPDFICTGSGQEAAMAPKSKRRSVMDRLRELLDKLNQLGPLLKPKTLQPELIPVRNRGRRTR